MAQVTKTRPPFYADPLFIGGAAATVGLLVLWVSRPRRCPDCAQRDAEQGGHDGATVHHLAPRGPEPSPQAQRGARSTQPVPAGATAVTPAGPSEHGPDYWPKPANAGQPPFLPPLPGDSPAGEPFTEPVDFTDPAAIDAAIAHLDPELPVVSAEQLREGLEKMTKAQIHDTFAFVSEDQTKAEMINAVLAGPPAV